MRTNMRFFVAFSFLIGAVSISLIGCANRESQSHYYSQSPNTNVFKPTPCPFYNEYLRPLPENDEEYAVYTAFLSSLRFNAGMMVIRDSTVSGSMENVQWLKSYTSASDEVIEDYLANEKQNRKLENYFNICGEVFLLDGKKINQFAATQENWEDFRQKYPQAWGIINFSRVGFNIGRTQALVGVKTICGQDCGTSQFWFFEKRNNKWDFGETAMDFIPNDKN